MRLKNLFSKGSQNQGVVDFTVKRGEITIEVTDPSVVRQMQMISLTVEELSYAPLVQSVISDHLDKITAAFYDSVLQIELLRNLIESHSSIERLHNTLKAHIYEMFSGTIDQDYLDKRLRIALVHYRIGLEPKWYMGSFQNLMETILDIIEEKIKDRELVKRMQRLTRKILNFEQQLVLEAYERENINQREMQYTKVKEEIKEQVAKLSQELASLSEQTSASVQELQAASQGVNSSVHNSVQQSKTAQKSAETEKMKVDALESNMEEMHRNTSSLVSMVKELATSSEEIQNVISIVQEIAEQTNLLSLNSSIEAARAGEHGRGFAVVAQEVKNLSEKTKESVKQIEKLIIHSNQLTNEVVSSIQALQKQMTYCTNDVNTTNHALTQMVQSINHSITEVSRVEFAIRELTRGIDEIGNATQKVVLSAERLNDSIQSV